MAALMTYEKAMSVTSMAARVEAADWLGRMREIAAAPSNQRVRMMKQIGEQSGISWCTIRNKFYAYQKNEAALIDRRRVKHLSAANPWLECYMTYVENDRNTSKNGWRQMMADFRSGKPMIGMIGTWRDVWARERGFEPMPQECPLDWIPHGATYENLQEVSKRNPDYYFNILSTRRGRKARRDAHG